MGEPEGARAHGRRRPDGGGGALRRSFRWGTYWIAPTFTGLAHSAAALYALLRWRADVHPDAYVGSQFRIAGEVVLGLVLLWGLLRLYRALCLRRPVVVDSTHYPATITVPSPRIARFYRPIVLRADEVLDVELVGHDSLLRGERRFRLAVNTTGGPLLSDAITSPYLRSRPGPALRATEVVDELRRAVRGIA